MRPADGRFTGSAGASFEGARLSTVVTMELPDAALAADVIDGLAQVEDGLREAAQAHHELLAEASRHLISAGGKRFRATLVLLAAQFGQPKDERIVPSAVAIELTHLATLYHDDVMDEALVRRNVESVNARFGNLVAIVAGDFLLARSAEIAASLGTEIAGLLANTLALLCQGQVTEVRSAYDTERTEDDYVRTIAGKTAALMSTSCRIGALTGGLPRTEVDTLTDFGRCFGMLFQLRDDILDVVATDEELGKPAGQDLAEGIYTLPVLRALADPVTAPELRPLLGAPLEQPERDKARSIVAGSGAIAETVAAGHRFVAEAVEAAGTVPERTLGRSLEDLARSLLEGLPVSR